MSGTVVVGLDVGGTSTRAAALSLDGVRLGAGRAGGGNPTSHGAERAAQELLVALRAALAEVDPPRVRAGAIGLAGAGRLLADPAGRAAFDRAWHDAGLRCPYAVHGDALVAYASGTAVPDGTVLIAGTGAIAAQVHDLRLDRTADGHGWLLGDAGSGFWLGREAVRRLLTDLDRARPPGVLATRVLADLTGTAEVAARPRATAEAVVQAVTRRPPVELARLAPLVVAAAAEGEPTGLDLVAQAAALLAESVTRIRPAGASDPVVLGGGLLTGDTPLAEAARVELARRWPDAPVCTAGDGAAAAAWLAARDLPEVMDPAALHALLVPPPV
ncbi:BadF/BadG/BcrA/BcrD ATPase family protein [Micromonospora sp. 4G57]|uniref:BadF/BadG/BcrA/BcrD ATPase family protein n=1 Tax=Micromonospora sicca TaxID=2202420 RepID=A0ABU5JH07_9ACTN|nr:MULTISPECIES: BadF/BadG/BcrA/BcrD ATPase family protein [unclassified Micromonospora]MDZ5444017.1 BadF/BadG/BcrA/BcrD ATPase family protein [Micromonospora sp. 4G57]MDZ5491856.1 BadF/BadG/BcrA/BcrD ATPase family protein [Micromonospora sp. 4G53]